MDIEDYIRTGKCINILKIRDYLKTKLEQGTYNDLWNGWTPILTAKIKTRLGTITMYAADENDKSKIRYRLEMPYGCCGTVLHFCITNDDFVDVYMVGDRNWLPAPEAKRGVPKIVEKLKEMGIKAKGDPNYVF